MIQSIQSTSERNPAFEKILLTVDNLSGYIKKFLITAFCIKGTFDIRKLLGFENTAIIIISIFTAMFSSLAIIPLPHESNYNTEDFLVRIRKKAFFLGSLGFIISLVAITSLEFSFQMTQFMSRYIG